MINDSADVEAIEVKTIWRWLKNLVSQMRSYAETISKITKQGNQINQAQENLFERKSRLRDNEVKIKLLRLSFQATFFLIWLILAFLLNKKIQV